MRRRLLIGIPLAVLIIGLLALDGYLSEQNIVWHVGTWNVATWLTNGALCTLVVLVLTVLTARELVQFARVRGYRPFGVTAQFFAAALVIGPYISFNFSPLTGFYDESWGMFWLALTIGTIFLLQARTYGTSHAMENTAITLFIVFYSGGLAGFMTKLRMEVGGATGIALLLLSVFVVKMTDTGAYFVGKFLGRNKLVAWLSPKKTWEGFIGGLITCVLSAVLVGHWLHVEGLIRLDDRIISHHLVFGIVGLLLGLISVAGDLCASLLKRDAEVKDSGRALPGLGGMLDVFDSPLLAAPLAWLLWTRVFQIALAVR
jgi:phosphatidate cytidylyltransferase